jgi:asparagine synthase (glutamine-hydrolysing)
VSGIINTNSIAMLLTLRYDPSKKPMRKPLTKDDFHPKYGEWDNESDIIKLIEEELSTIHRLYKFNHISLSLSGGVDSQLTLAMLRRFLPTVKVTCIGVGFGNADDEVGRAKEIARVYDSDFHELMLDDVLCELPQLISIVGEPRWNLYHYYAFEYGKHISDYFFTGDGGDELFGGYTFRYSKFLSLCPSNASWEERAKRYLSCHERDWVPDQENMFGKAINFSWSKIYALFEPYFQNTLDPLDQVFLADFNGKLLFDWLPTNRAFEEHLGIRIRSLFLDDRMIKFAFGLPWNKKYDLKTQGGKLPLRSLLSKQKGVYDANNFSKKGFSVELEYLWNKNAREITTKYLNAESEIVRNNLINSDWLTAHLDDLEEKSTQLDPRYINKMLSLLALEIWYRIFISHSIKSSEKL